MKKTAKTQSIHQKLLNVRDKTGEQFNHVLIRYGLERLLFRLVASGHDKQFILKGAMLFALWEEVKRRPTRDIDLLGLGEVNHKKLREIFTDVCNSSRSASWTACLVSALHSGVIKSTGPSGAVIPTLKTNTPPTPTRAIASRSAVMPSREILPLTQNQ